MAFGPVHMMGLPGSTDRDFHVSWSLKTGCAYRTENALKWADGVKASCTSALWYVGCRTVSPIAECKDGLTFMLSKGGSAGTDPGAK